MPKKDIIAPILFLLAAAAAPACAQTGRSDALVPPSHPLIRYTGRFDKRSPQNYRFDWPGNIIELRFGGASCAVRIRGDGGYYNIYVDDKKSVMRFDTLERVHILADSLAADTAHHLKIVKRFEGLKEQVAELKGFYIGKGKALYPLPEEGPFPYRIEFIGGSNLLGFGVEANTVHCDSGGLFRYVPVFRGGGGARAWRGLPHRGDVGQGFDARLQLAVLFRSAPVRLLLRSYCEKRFAAEVGFQFVGSRRGGDVVRGKRFFYAPAPAQGAFYRQIPRVRTGDLFEKPEGAGSLYDFVAGAAQNVRGGVGGGAAVGGRRAHPFLLVRPNPQASVRLRLAPER